MYILMKIRLCWILRQEILHHAVPVLRLQQCVQLRQQKRQVLLAEHHSPHPHDASHRVRNQKIYF